MKWTALTLVLGLLAAPLAADTALFQARQPDPFLPGDYVGTQTTYMRSQQANNNFGAASALTDGASSLTNVFRPLVRFDIATSFAQLLASNPGMAVQINSATMTLNCDGFAGSGPLTIEMYAMPAADGDWVDGSSMYTTEDGTACWNYKAYSATTPVAWSLGVGMGYGETVDTPSELLDSHVYSATGNGDFNVPVGTATLWLSNTTNYGVLLINTSEYIATETLSFRSDDHLYGTPPKLVVDYTLVPVPEPATMGLLALGGLALLRRRKA